MNKSTYLLGITAIISLAVLSSIFLYNKSYIVFGICTFFDGMLCGIFFLRFIQVILEDILKEEKQELETKILND